MIVNNEHVFFYGASDWPSNFYYAPYILYSYEFPTVEHGFQWHKAVFFGDRDTAEKILSADQPLDAKRLGGLVKEYDDDRWKAVKNTVMLQHVSAKMEQHPEFYREGIEHVKHGRRFVEASKSDHYWGIGMFDREASKVDPDSWPGENHLGHILTLYFRTSAAKNIWYQANWSWFEREEPEEVSEEDSNEDYFVTEEIEDDDDE